MKGKVAIITASCTGIGKAIAERLAKEGATVIVSNKTEEHIAQTVSQFRSKGYEVYGMVCDVGKKADRTNLINKTIEKYGKINYIVPNAAITGGPSKFLDAKDPELQEMWNINYHSVFFLIQQALPHLKKQKGSAIVLLASNSGHELHQVIGQYAITKTAIIALTKMLGKQLLDDEIRVNCVSPGVIKTEMSQFLWRRGEEKATRYNGVKRLGIPDDIAKVVHFLLSDEAGYMTGESVVIAGRPGARL